MNKADLVTEASFNELADAICQPQPGIDRSLLSIGAESSDFVRFNRNQVRQATRVQQFGATLSLVSGAKRISSAVSLGPNFADNLAVLKTERDALAQSLPVVPDDPYLILPDTISSSSRQDPNGLLASCNDVINEITQAADGTDLVGFYAAGPTVVGFADSRGQRNWHRVESFHFDWSLYLDVAGSTDRAVKSAYAGKQWRTDELQRRMQEARDRLEPLSRQAKTLKPGNYRAFISPAAMTELLGGLAWSGFSRKDRETGTSSLSLLAQGKQAMNAAVTMTESTSNGIAPAFTGTGYIRPDSVELIKQGKAVDCLVSPRSASEFGESANADAGESPGSLSLAPGQTDPADALAKLGTGIWISNLWYLNYSDRPNCRMTGMTRFASFWVEDGKLIAPITPMRFDDSVISLFGEKLIDLTSSVEFMPDSSTWDARHMSSITAPGMLVRDMTFTL